MGKINIKQMVISGLMAALVLVGTMLIQIPTPTKGYIHVGDSMVYLCGILLGPLAGGLAAGIGSLLADVFLGYGIYAPATFVIKTLDAFMVGYIYHKMITDHNFSITKKMIAYVFGALLGGTIMVLGYLGYEWILYGWGTAILGVIGNITQAIGGGILAAPLVIALDKIKIFQNLKENYKSF